MKTQSITIATRKWMPRWMGVFVAALVILGLLFTIWIGSLSRGISADMQALTDMGIPTTQQEVDPPLKPLEYPSAADDIYRAAWMFLPAGEQRHAFDKLMTASPYAPYVRSLELKISATKTRRYYDGEFLSDLRPMPADYHTVTDTVRILKPTLDVLRSRQGPCTFFSNNYVPGEQRPFNPSGPNYTTMFESPGQMDATMQLLTTAASVELLTGNYKQANLDFFAAGDDLYSLTFPCMARNLPGTGVAQEERLRDDFLIRLWLLARKKSDDVKAMEVIRNAASLIQEPVNGYKQVCNDFPGILKNYQTAREDPDAYENLYRHSTQDVPWYASNKTTMNWATRQAIHEWREAFEKMKSNQNNFSEIKTALDVADLDERRRWPEGTLLETPFKQEAEEAKFRTHNVARHRLLQCAIAIMYERARTHKFPTIMPTLAKDSIDPYNGKQLIYKPGLGGFVLYSVGENLKDDHTTSTPTELPHDGDDIAIAF